MVRIYPYPGAEHPDLYELENRMADPDRRLEAAMARHISCDERVVVDVGAGSGFHAVRYAAAARHVYVVEPEPRMLKQCFRRLAGSDRANVSVLATHAEAIPLADATAHIVHARFAYFFGLSGGQVASCEPGLREGKRLLRPGGCFFIIDNAWDRGRFAAFLHQAYGRDGASVQDANAAFYAEHGFACTIIPSCWRAPDRDALRRVLAMEFPAAHVADFMAQIEGTELEVAYSLYTYRHG